MKTEDALKWGEALHGPSVWDTSARTLAAEVRRLRADASRCLARFGCERHFPSDYCVTCRKNSANVTFAPAFTPATVREFVQRAYDDYPTDAGGMCRVIMRMLDELENRR